MLKVVFKTLYTRPLFQGYLNLSIFLQFEVGSDT